MKKKILCFDIDNVICKTIDSKYHLSVPIKKNIQIINYYYKKGFIIKIFTSRYMGRNKDVATKARFQGYNFTKNQLLKWGVNYHKLIFGKPSYDIFVDDKALFFKPNWILKIKKILKN